MLSLPGPFFLVLVSLDFVWFTFFSSPTNLFVFHVFFPFSRGSLFRCVQAREALLIMLQGLKQRNVERARAVSRSEIRDLSTPAV